MDKITRAGQTDNNRSLTETSGPTRLVMADVADGEYLMRDGGTIKGGPGGGSPPVEDVVGVAPISVNESPAKTFNISHDDSTQPSGVIPYPQSVTTDDQGHIIAASADPFLNGEGLVYGRSAQGRTAVSLSGLLCVPELSNKVYGITVATNGLLLVLDKITREFYTLATHTSKSFLNAIYSPHASSGRLFLNYGASSMSVNASTGAAITTGIGKNFQGGACIRTSDGVLYGYNASASVHRIDTTTDTAGADIAVTGTGNSGTRKNITYCPINDSVYFYTNVKVGRINCVTNTEVAVITPAGLAGGTNAGWVLYNGWSGKIFTGCVGSANLVQIDPSVDAQQTSYPFPPGAQATGTTGAISLGRYLYIGTGATTPTEILIFDCQNFEFVGCLNASSGSVQTSGNFMCGEQGDVLEDSFLYAAPSATSWFYWGGRL